MRWIAYGPGAILLQFADRVGEGALARGRALVAELERNPPHGLVEFVPAFTTLLLEFDPQTVPSPATVAPDLVTRLQAAMTMRLPLAPITEIPVVDDGEDLERVAKLHKLSAEDVGQIHAKPIYKVYMLGFAPGFPYLGDLDRRLHTPRLATPRPLVPAGSVAIGGGGRRNVI